VKAGPGLYRETINHAALSDALAEREGPWVLTIDDASLYPGYPQTPLSVAGNRKKSLDTVVCSRLFSVPTTTKGAII
jgi:hypothetical protein